MKEYEEGQKAREQNVKLDDCPYPTNKNANNENKKRLDWMKGWLDANSSYLFPNIFGE